MLKQSLTAFSQLYGYYRPITPTFFKTMIILTNGFPTNMPDSEKVSQGGPANFARLFKDYLTSIRAKDHWIGVMIQGSPSQTTRLVKKYNLPKREYYRLFIPKKILRNIVRAKIKGDSSQILEVPIARLTALMRESKPDIVFLNGFGMLNWMLLKAARTVGIPTVIQHAGIWTKELRIHKDLYTLAGRKMMEEMEKDSTRLTAAEIFLNEWSKDYYHSNVAKRSDNEDHIIPLPFNFSTFKDLRTEVSRISTPFELDTKLFNIGIIARWDKIKNHKAILALAKEINHQKLPWQIYAVTTIPDIPKYKKIKKEYEKYIKVIPALDRPGVSAFCQSVDLLIQPSLFDVSPTVVLEAISSGTPIAISPTVGHVHNFLKHQAIDWVLDFSDARQVVGKIKKISGRPMPNDLKNFLISAHDHRNVFDAYLNLFSRIGRVTNTGKMKSLSLVQSAGRV
ncbi:MAG: glycosyltransferase [bacterium]|nr:glycosyltransferase [bacterium]